MSQKSTLGIFSFVIIVSSVFLFSCGTMQRFHQDTLAARDTSNKSFVVKNDGTVIKADEARLRMPLFGKSTVILDGDQKIPAKEIIAYQNNTAYYRKVDGQFAPRIKKGLINMYLTEQTYQEYDATPMGPGSTGRWRTRTRIVYYLQKGDNAATETFSPGVTRKYVQDYAPAMEFMNVYDANKQKYKIWSYINTAATLGGLALLVTKGIDNNDKLTTVGYVGTGLFFGGLVNGFVNKFHKAHNYKNLEIAIDTYNGQVIKKKRKP